LRSEILNGAEASEVSAMWAFRLASSLPESEECLCSGFFISRRKGERVSLRVSMISLPGSPKGAGTWPAGFYLTSWVCVERMESGVGGGDRKLELYEAKNRSARKLRG
jgi:hypothetical protein